MLRQPARHSFALFSRSLSTSLCRRNTTPAFPESPAYPDPGPNPHIAYPARDSQFGAPEFPMPLDLDATGESSADPNRSSYVDIPPAEDPLLQFLSSMLLVDGKRKQADRQVSRMLLHIHTLTRREPLELVREAVRAASPFVRTYSVRSGAKVFHLPIPLSEKQRTHTGVKWILEASKKRIGQTVEERLAREMIAILTATKPEENEVLKKKKQLHEFTMQNRGTKMPR